MSYAKQSREFLTALIDEFEEDEIGQIFLGASIVTSAEDIAKRNPDHVYQGFIRGSQWTGVAKRILEIRKELYAVSQEKALTLLDQRPEPATSGETE